jgi:hypothetical protein
LTGIDRLQRFRLEDEAVGWSIEASNGQKLGNAAPAVDACNVNDHVDGQGDGFADASMRQPDVRGQHAMREPRQGLVGRIRMDRAEASEVTGVEGLQEVERLSPAYLADDDAIGPMPQRRTQQVRDGHSRQRCLVNNRTYRRVARADLESAISIIDAMSEAVHRDDYIEIEDAFDTMAVRASIALCNLLKLWKTRH